MPTDRFVEARRVSAQDDAAGYPPEGAFQTTVPPEIELPSGWLDAAIERANKPEPPTTRAPTRRVFTRG